jgi:octopine/nopaline transport system permease protein
MLTSFELIGFGPKGWGYQILDAALMTVAVSCSAFLIGLLFGTLGAFAKLSGRRPAMIVAGFYTTVVRGVPDLLIIYLFYFGGSSALSTIGRLFGAEGFIGVPAFLTGALAVGIVSGAYQTEVLRGAYLAIAKGELEAARAVGMGALLRLRRIIAPQVMRFALPGLGNVWQVVLKESALISVTGLTELLRQAQVASGSTKQPFTFYVTAAAAYLVLTSISSWLFRRAEVQAMRGVRPAWAQTG